MNLRGPAIILSIIFFTAIAAQAMEEEKKTLSEEFFQKKVVQAYFLEPAPIVHVKTADNTRITISRAKLASLSAIWGHMMSDVLEDKTDQDIVLDISFADFAVIAHLHFLKAFDVNPQFVQTFEELQNTSRAAELRELCHKLEALDATAMLDNVTPWRSLDEKKNRWFALANSYKQNPNYKSFSAIYLELWHLDDKERKLFEKLLADEGVRKETLLVPKKRNHDASNSQIAKSLAFILFFRDQLPQSCLVKLCLKTLGAIFYNDPNKSLDADVFYAIKSSKDGSFSVNAKRLSSKQDLQNATNVIVTVLNILADFGLKPSFTKSGYNTDSDLVISGLAKTSRK